MSWEICAVKSLLLNLVRILFVQMEWILWCGFKALSYGGIQWQLLLETPQRTVWGSSLSHQLSLVFCLLLFWQGNSRATLTELHYIFKVLRSPPTAEEESCVRSVLHYKAGFGHSIRQAMKDLVVWNVWITLKTFIALRFHLPHG